MLKRFVKAPLAKALLTRVSREFSPSLVGAAQSNTQIQRLIQLQFLETRRRGERLSFAETGFRAFSASNEDGIILYILTCIGMETRQLVEVCCGTGIECMGANLILNHGYTGLLLDGDPKNIEICRSFFQQHPDSRIWPPSIRQAWITRSNINSLIEESGIKGEIDLLSIDVDGVDYWLWEALNIVSPRLVVVEFQDLWGDSVSVTVPYSDDFRAVWIDGYPDHCGASLEAFIRLARRKGYRLIGTNSLGYNAFFLRNDIAADWFPEVSSADCLRHPKAQFGALVRRKNAAKFPWVEV